VNPAVAAAMGEIRVDISRGDTQATRRRAGRSRGHRDLDGLRRRLPRVRRQALPGVGAARPSRLSVEQVRPIRDEIAARVRAQLKS